MRKLEIRRLSATIWDDGLRASQVYHWSRTSLTLRLSPDFTDFRYDDIAKRLGYDYCCAIVTEIVHAFEKMSSEELSVFFDSLFHRYDSDTYDDYEDFINEALVQFANTKTDDEINDLEIRLTKTTNIGSDRFLAGVELTLEDKGTVPLKPDATTWEELAYYRSIKR